MREFTKSLDEIIETFEKNIIQQTLKDTHGNQAKAAAVLGISKRKINYKITKHKIDSRSIKEEHKATEHFLESWHHYSKVVKSGEQGQSLLLP
jgi:hypothetical protein